MDNLKIRPVAKFIEYPNKDQMIQNHEHYVNDPGKFHVSFIEKVDTKCIFFIRLLAVSPLASRDFAPRDNFKKKKIKYF